MSKVSIKAVLWTYQKSKTDTYPIKICVRINRKATYIHTGYFAREQDWRNDMVVNQPNANLINANIRQRLNELEKNVLTKQMNGQSVTRKSLSFVDDTSFFSFARKVRADEKELTRILNFAKSDLMVSDINVNFLRDYERHERARGMAGNTINTEFKYLRRILNQAVLEGVIQKSPLESYQMPKYVQSDRVYLNEDELKEVQKMVGKLSGMQAVVLDYFLLGCYSGLRHSDWERFDKTKMVHNGALRIRAKKNKTWVTLPIGKTLAGVIKRINEPIISNQKCNVYLKTISDITNINKVLTCHASRHTFGYLCASNGLPKQVTAELMGINVKTVEVYYHLEGSDVMKQASALLKL